MPGLAAAPQRARLPHGPISGQRSLQSPATRLSHPSLCSGTTPLSQAPFGAFPRGVLRAVAIRYRSPTPAQVSAFYAGKDKGGRKRDAEGRLSEPLGERRGSRSLEAKGRLLLKPVPVSFLAGPWGPRTGDCRERSEFLIFFPGYGAEPCRLALAERRGRQVFLPFSRPLLQLTLTPASDHPQEGLKEGLQGDSF